MDPTMERLVEIEKELVAEGKVNGYNTTTEYAKKVKALGMQMKRVKEANAAPKVEAVIPVKAVKASKGKK